jgi:hypothetical protein
MRISGVLGVFIVWILGNCCPALALPAEGRAFAVFSVAYNPGSTQVKAGVMGTAFFISPTKAVTAYHVVQPKSFLPPEGYSRVKIWLVHEGEPAIELQKNNVTYFSSADQSVIQLKAGRVNSRYVFTAAAAIDPGAPVMTEGFPANTQGPELAWSGSDIVVTAVPRLERVRFNGAVARISRVELNAADVKLRGAPCIELTYKPLLGLSGGPVISAAGEVVAMNSFSDPRTRAATWAVALALPKGMVPGQDLSRNLVSGL